MSARTSAVCRLSPAEIGVLAFNGLYLAVGLYASLQRENSEFILYVVVLCVLMAAVTALHMRIRLPLAALWGLSLWGLAHMAGGLLPIPESYPRHGAQRVLYNLWIVPGMLKFDQLVHAYGFGIVTWICWLALRSSFHSQGVEVKPTCGPLTLCVAAGMGFGAANEVVEFLATILLPETNVGGYENTGWDLVANSVGALIAAVLIRLWPVRVTDENDRRAG